MARRLYHITDLRKKYVVPKASVVVKASIKWSTTAKAEKRKTFITTEFITDIKSFMIQTAEL